MPAIVLHVDSGRHKPSSGLARQTRGFKVATATRARLDITRERDDMATSIEEILSFWFGETPSNGDEVDRLMSRWFGGDTDVETAIRRRFETAVHAAARGELEPWTRTARGRLATILLLDQFPRSLYRGTAAAFAQDQHALTLTTAGIASGMDAELSPLERIFFYMPMQHSESLAVQSRGVQLFESVARGDPERHLRKTLEAAAQYARLHRDIVERFGHFPHRNAALGRRNTAEEDRYLEEGAPTFGQ
jgi:uncharacterized protein (DUF924 family)